VSSLAVKKLSYVVAVACALAIATDQSSVHAQEKVTVLSDGPLRPALIEIGEAFRRETGNQVEFVFATSPVVHKKVADGEIADVLIIQPNFVAELVKAGKVVPGEHPVVGRVGFGLAVRADAPARSISTTEAFKRILLDADSLIFNNVASGNYFAKVLERLGIAEAVKPKVIRLDPSAVNDRLLRGKGNDIGVGVIPLITTTKGLRLLGPLPPEVQSYIAYAAAPMASSTSPQAGKAFINFLTSPTATAVLAAHGVE
jgi:molybdate transport system substrate-binding protein